MTQERILFVNRFVEIVEQNKEMLAAPFLCAETASRHEAERAETRVNGSIAFLLFAEHAKDFYGTLIPAGPRPTGTTLQLPGAWWAACIIPFNPIYTIRKSHRRSDDGQRGTVLPSEGQPADFDEVDRNAGWKLVFRTVSSSV